MLVSQLDGASGLPSALPPDRDMYSPKESFFGRSAPGVVPAGAAASSAATTAASAASPASCIFSCAAFSRSKAAVSTPFISSEVALIGASRAMLLLTPLSPFLAASGLSTSPLVTFASMAMASSAFSPSTFLASCTAS
eukprot:scaffold104058_cov62-Phaeocystis_antarctica.AAC.1